MKRIVAKLVRPDLPIRRNAEVGDTVKVLPEEYETFGPKGTTHLSYMREENHSEPTSKKPAGPKRKK